MTSHEDLASVFAALASRHRRQIVHLLALQPASIQQLAQRIGISLTALHRHLRVLEDANDVPDRAVIAQKSNFESQPLT